MCLFVCVCVCVCVNILYKYHALVLKQNALPPVMIVLMMSLIRSRSVNLDHVKKVISKTKLQWSVLVSDCFQACVYTLLKFKTFIVSSCIDKFESDHFSCCAPLCPISNCLSCLNNGSCVPGGCNVGYYSVYQTDGWKCVGELLIY